MKLTPSEVPARVAPGQPLELSEGESLWWWSPDCAPKRFDWPLPEKLACEPSAKRAVSFRTAAGSVSRGTPVRWGTADMLKDLPDMLLPEAVTGEDGRAAVPASAKATVFVRAAGPSLAGPWLRVGPGSAPAATVALPASASSIKVLAATGEPAGRLSAELTIRDGLYRAESGGRTLDLPPLPRDEVVSYLIWDKVSAPLQGKCRVSALPAMVRLPAPGLVRARCLEILDAEERPIPGAKLEATFILPGGARGLRRTAVSGATGSAVLTGLLPDTVADLLVTHEGHAPVKKKLRVVEGVNDLGRIVLETGRRMVVRVGRELDGKPLPGADLRVSELGIRASSDEKGLITLAAVPAEPPPRAWVSASGFLGKWLPLSPEGDDAPLDVRLQKAASLTARVVFADTGEPAGPGRVVLEWDGGATYTYDFARPGQMGALELLNLPAGKLTLEVRADGLCPLRLPPRTLVPGENVALGEIRLSRGLSISGVVLSELSGQPLAGAEIRAPRPSPFGLRLSVLRGDVATASTDADGRFRVGGLAPGTYSVLIEAPGHGPLLRAGLVVSEEATSGDLDLGTIGLSEAREIDLTCRPEGRCGSQAQLLLGGPENDWAAVSASLEKGHGHLYQVPAGSFSLRLAERGATIVTRQIDVARDRPVTPIEITLPSVEVLGEVLQGGRSVSEGTVLFRAAGSVDRQPAIFLTPRTESGSEAETQVVGDLPRSASASVDSNGRFSIADLIPGAYEVTYSGPGGAAKPRHVDVPEAARFAVRLELPEADVTGSVVDEHGTAPGWANVTVTDREGTVRSTRADKEGRFRLTGLARGRVVVKARNDDAEASEEVEIREAGNEVNLVLKAKPAPRLLVEVAGASGEPLPGALVFLVEDGSPPRPATADTDGTAHYKLRDETHRVQVAAFHPSQGWAFSDSIAASPGEARLGIAMARSTGGLLVLSEKAASAVSIVTPRGFALEMLMGLLGLSGTAAPGEPLRLRGLPPGLYQVASPGRTPVSATVAGGEERTVRL